MHMLRLVIAISCLMLMVLAVPGGAVEEDRTCTWVGDTEVCVPPR